MVNKLPSILLKTLALALLLGFVTSCTPGYDKHKSVMHVSVADQKMLLTQHGKPVKVYPVSTSKFGLGDVPRSMCTPLGKMKVAKKIGGGAELGTVFKSRQPTGEVLKPNAPGRDPIVTRILWLKGTQMQNRKAFQRYIYIHGTPEERTVGTPASYGCIRMKSKDIIDLYDRIGVHANVIVTRDALQDLKEGKDY